MELNMLQLLHDKKVEINSTVHLHIPTLKQIMEIDEKNYFSIVQRICCTSSDLKWQLDEQNINYMDYQDDYEFFINIIAPTLPKIITKILFEDQLDFTKMKVVYSDKSKSFILKQKVVIQSEVIVDSKARCFIKNKLKIPLKTKMKTDEYEFIIDRYAYDMITTTLRTIHGLKRSFETPANERTRKLLIFLAREEYERLSNKEYEPVLFPLVSTMVNSADFKENYNTVFDMNIFAFMDSVKRIQKTFNAKLLLQSAYSGFGVNVKDLNKKDIDWIGNLYR